MVLSEIEDIIERRLKCLVQHQLCLVKHNNINREFSAQTKRDHQIELLPVTLNLIEVFANLFEDVDHLLQRDTSCIHIYKFFSAQVRFSYLIVIFCVKRNKLKLVDFFSDQV